MSLPTRALVIAGLLLGSATQAHAGAEWGFSPGVKAGWTFGRGFTYGFEISFVRIPDLQIMDSGSFLRDAVDAGVKFITHTYGVVLNIDHVHHAGLSRMRVGGEWIGPFTGVEAGPVLVIDRDTTSLGFGITSWAGYTFFPYYTYTYVFGSAPNQHELGVYLKTPLLIFKDDADEGHLHEGIDLD